MGINFKGYDEYYRSKVPLKFVLIAFIAMAVNLFLITCFQLSTTFRFAGPVDSETLGKMDSRFRNCTVLDTATDSSQFPTEHSVFLLETAEDETYAVTLEKHFLADRYRYREEMVLSVPHSSGEQPVSSAAVRYDISLWVQDDSKIANFQASSKFDSFISSCLISSAMCIVELIVYGFVFRKEELA